MLVLEYSCKFCAVLLLVNGSIVLPANLNFWPLQSIHTRKKIPYKIQGDKYHALSALNTRMLSPKTCTSHSNSNYVADLWHWEPKATGLSFVNETFLNSIHNPCNSWKTVSLPPLIPNQSEIFNSGLNEDSMGIVLASNNSCFKLLHFIIHKYWR